MSTHCINVNFVDLRESVGELNGGDESLQQFDGKHVDIDKKAYYSCDNAINCAYEAM